MFKRKRKIRISASYKRRRRRKSTPRQAFKKNRKEFKKTHPKLFKKSPLPLIIFGIIIIGLIGYFLFFSQAFIVRNIEFPENHLSDKAVEEALRSQLQNLEGENMFRLNTTDIELKLKTKFKELELIEVDKDLPDTLNIEFEEYTLVANVVYESNGMRKSFIVNTIGYAVKENLESPSLPYIRIQSDEPINPHRPILEANKLRYILETITYYTDKFGMRVKEIEYKPIAREVHLLTERDFKIWLDVQRPSEEQLKKLKKALVKLDIYNEDLEYIDLRITGNNGNKIIYK